MNESNQTSALAVDQTIFDHRLSRKQGTSDASPHQSYVSLLNEAGIRQWQNGVFGEAVRCFRSAWNNMKPSPLIVSSRPEKVIDTSVSTEQGEIVVSNEDKADKALYVYQRDEYDEGMHAYSQPIHIEDDYMDDTQIAATIAYNLGQGLVRQGAYEEALGWFRTADKEIRGTRHAYTNAVHTVAIQHNLGHCTYRLGRYESSMEHYQAALLAGCALSLGEIELAATFNCIAVLHFHNSSDDTDKAVNLFEKCLEIRQRVLGPNHIDVATVLNNIGRIHYLRNEFPEALRMYTDALRIRRQLLGNNNMDVAATIYNTGQTHHHMGDIDAAMSHYQEFLQIAKCHLGSEHRDVAITYKCIAQIHQERKELGVAMEMFVKSLKTGRAALGNYHPEIATTLNKLGNLAFELGDLDGAMQYYEEGLKVEKAILAPDHPHIVVTMTNIAQVYKHRGNFDAAIKQFEDVHEMQIRVLGPNH